MLPQLVGDTPDFRVLEDHEEMQFSTNMDRLVTND